MTFPSLRQRIRTKNLLPRNSDRRRRSHVKRLLPLPFRKIPQRDNSEDAGTVSDHPSCNPPLKPRVTLSTIAKNFIHGETAPSNADCVNRARLAVHPQDHDRSIPCPYDGKCQKKVSPELDAQTKFSVPVQGIWSYPPPNIGKPPTWLPAQEDFLQASAPCMSESSDESIVRELSNLSMEVPPVRLNSSLEVTCGTSLPTSPEDISSPTEIFLQPRKKDSKQLEGTACLHLPLGIQPSLPASPEDISSPSEIFLQPRKKDSKQLEGTACPHLPLGIQGIDVFEKKSVSDENNLFDVSVTSKVDHSHNEQIIPPVHMCYASQSKESTPAESTDSLSLPSSTPCKAMSGHSGLKPTDSRVSMAEKEDPLHAGFCKECGNSLRTGSRNMFSAASNDADSISSPENQAGCSDGADVTPPRKTWVNGSSVLNEAILGEKEIIIYGPIIQNLVAETVTFEKVGDMREQ